MNERDREVVHAHAEGRSERLRNERADAIPRLVNVAVALAPALRAFALNATAAAERMAEAFGLPHPNACALCGRGEGEWDHGLEHAYERPSAEMALIRMRLRVRRERRTRLATRSARTRWRARVELADHDRRMRERPTEHEVTRTPEERLLNQFGLTSTPPRRGPVTRDLP